MRLVVKAFTAAAILAACLAAAPIPAHAADFTGKRVTVIVPSEPTSALATYARFAATHIARQLPGTPKPTVRTVKDAASAAKALRTAKPDGRTILALAGPHIMDHLLAKPIAKQQIGTFVPVLLSPKGSAVRIDPAFAIKIPKDLEKLKGLRATYAGNNPKSVDLRATFMFELLGVSLTPVWLGAERHDYKPSSVTILSDATGALLTTAARKEKPIPVWSGGAVQPDGTIGRDPAYSNLPHFLEAYKIVNGLALSGGPRQAFDAIFHATLTAARALFLNGTTPPDIQNAYRAAVQNMFGDPDFRKGLPENLGPYRQLFGDKAREAFRKAAAPGPKTLTWIRNYSRMHGGKI